MRVNSRVLREKTDLLEEQATRDFPWNIFPNGKYYCSICGHLQPIKIQFSTYALERYWADPLEKAFSVFHSIINSNPKACVVFDCNNISCARLHEESIHHPWFALWEIEPVHLHRFSFWKKNQILPKASWVFYMPCGVDKKQVSPTAINAWTRDPTLDWKFREPIETNKDCER